jgi:hypothetical protein
LKNAYFNAVVYQNDKRMTSVAKVSNSGGLAGLFSIIILILLVAPIAAMSAPQSPGRLVDVGGVLALTCIFTVLAREAQL